MKNYNRGSIVFSLLLILILTGLSAGILLRSVNENKVAQRLANATQALWLADAGLQRVKYEKNTNNCVGMTRQDTGVACTDCTCGSVTKVFQTTLTGSGDIDATLDSSNATVISTGSVPSRTSLTMITRRVQGTFGSGSLFSYAAFARGQVTINNNALVDSYNSTSGAYGGANIKSNGGVGSNGTSAGIINVGNNGTVKGNASTGVGGTVSGGGTVTGTQTHTNNVTLASVTIPSALSGLTAQSAISSSNGATVTITAGSYKYPTIAMSNNSTLNITGDVTLYLTGTSTAMSISNNGNLVIANGGSLTIYTEGMIDFSNNAVINNVSANPSKMLIYSKYSSANTNNKAVNINNNGAAQMGIYAPDAAVSVNNNGGVYGAIVGLTVDISNNGALHYDENLANLANPFSSGTGISNWQET